MEWLHILPICCCPFICTGIAASRYPRLAESDDERSRGRQSSVSTADGGKFKRNRTRSTLRNFLGRLGRSTSQDLHNAGAASRTTMRSSESARFPLCEALGPVAMANNGPVSERPPVHQFVDWGRTRVCQWLTHVGFAPFAAPAEQSVRSGRHLLNMSDHELEKELSIKNQLHRKKLRCLLCRIERNTGDALNRAEPADKMNVRQVMLWLDVIGLPQYRDVFAENLIDGQMLLVLTARDLVEMGILSTMNHASISRAIQLLQLIDYSHHRLEKDLKYELLDKCPIAEEVGRWGHSCVAQWLKGIDLSEFTPNLAFSGIHGALMVNEPTFTAESLAEVLQIPVQKTLLRRHLTTHFNKLLGQDVIARKREALSQPFVTHLSPSTRVKLLKKGFSLARKKSRQDVLVEPDTLVCPSGGKCLSRTELTSDNDGGSLVESLNTTSNV